MHDIFMEKGILENLKFNFLTNEKVEFVHNFDEIASKISQILPFSKILLISSDDDFFEFGNNFFCKLVGSDLNAINLIYNHNIDKQVEDLISDYSFIDVRGIIVFSKKVLFTLIDKCPKIEKIFFVLKDVDTFGIFFNNSKNVHYFLNDNLFDEKYLIKSLAIKTVHLIDYAFRNALINQRVDTTFFSNQKKKLVSALFDLEDFINKKKKLFNLNLELENLICKSNYPFCSINVCSFLFIKDFFDFDCSFNFSIDVIKKVKAFLSAKLVNEKIDYSERAKIVSFLTNQDINTTLLDLKRQIEFIEDFDVIQLKQELKKLVLLYQNFCIRLPKSNDENSKSLKNKQLIKTCLSVSGDTKFSLNCNTYFREFYLTK